MNVSIVLGVYWSRAEGVFDGRDTTEASWVEQSDISPAGSGASNLPSAVMETAPWSACGV